MHNASLFWSKELTNVHNMHNGFNFDIGITNVHNWGHFDLGGSKIHNWGSILIMGIQICIIQVYFDFWKFTNVHNGGLFWYKNFTNVHNVVLFWSCKLKVFKLVHIAPFVQLAQVFPFSISLLCTFHLLQVVVIGLARVLTNVHDIHIIASCKHYGSMISMDPVGINNITK